MRPIKLEAIVKYEQAADAIASLAPFGGVLCRPTEPGEALAEVDREEAIALLNWSKEKGAKITVVAHSRPNQKYDAKLFADGLVEDFGGKLYGCLDEWQCHQRRCDAEKQRQDEPAPTSEASSTQVTPRARGARPWARS